MGVVETDDEIRMTSGQREAERDYQEDWLCDMKCNL